MTTQVKVPLAIMIGLCVAIIGIYLTNDRPAPTQIKVEPKVEVWGTGEQRSHDLIMMEVGKALWRAKEAEYPGDTLAMEREFARDKQKLLDDTYKELMQLERYKNRKP